LAAKLAELDRGAHTDVEQELIAIGILQVEAP
jgi:hypothetical protein